jgi:hypothetical protein
MKERNEYQKEYVEKNKEKIKQQQKEYYEKNREKINTQKYEYVKKNKEKIKQQQKEYYEKNREKIIKKQKDYYEKNIIKQPKEQKEKSIKQKNYLNNDDLYEQLLLSKAKSKATPELIKMMIDISTGLAHKLTYFNEDDRNDCKAEGLLQMVLNYHNFNEFKYNNALAYLTEICKRGMAKQFNEIHQIKTMWVIGSKNQTERVQLKCTNCDWTSNGYNF